MLFHSARIEMMAGMQVLLISDTHGVIDPRIAALSSSCDYVAHAGDIGAAAVLEALRPRRAIVAVRGNNDTPGQWPTHDLARLDALPGSAVLDLPGGALAIVHGHRSGPVAQRHQRLRTAFSTCRGVLYGHSHRLVLDTDALPWLINPGAAGRTRTYGGPSCVLLVARAKAWKVEALRFPLLASD